MIKQLAVEGVTVFAERSVFQFAPGVNVIVGGNDSGKSHLMKLCYAMAKWAVRSPKGELPEAWAEEQRLRRILLRVFGTRDLSSLASRGGDGAARVRASLAGEKASWGTCETGWSFSPAREAEGLHLDVLPQRYLTENAVYLPPRDVLAIYPCYVQAGKRYPELLDAAAWELCCALDAEGEPPAEGPLRHALQCAEQLLGGRLCRNNGRFYLEREGRGMLELNLAAEGYKRTGTLGLLLQNSTVRRGTVLFADEPETNLNARHLPLLVRLLLSSARGGVQVFLTTHSLFLLRELVIQLAEKNNARLSRRFIGLEPPESTGGSSVSQGETLSAIGPIASLQAEMEQADRYLSLNPGEPPAYE
ncbi:MAG: ATP/GTP-binding protein [Akkermansia muciniphila]